VDKPLTERQRLLLAEFVPNDYFHLAGPLNASLDTLLEKIPEFGLEVSLPSA
jgi:hypothetical protein